ncbi:MAG: hypothetical protein IJU98_01860 [Synergistaceae bacterium]|nr:hypothetical protein [Synergistaceae bacterium]
MPDSYKMRRTRIILKYNNKDISEDIAKNLLSFKWTDNSSRKADSLDIDLENTAGLWNGAWLPAKGATLTASIVHENWDGGSGIQTLPCGTFQIDETTVSGPPSKAQIKAVSVPIKTKARGQAKTHGWNDVHLSQIAGDIASDAGLSLMFDLQDDPHYQSEDQMEETDLAFLQGLCDDAGASLKVSHDRLVIFSEEEYEKKSSVLTFEPGNLTKWNMKNKSADVYKSCKVSYHDPETDTDIDYEEDADLADLSGEDDNGRTLTLNRRVKSRAEAQTLAKNSLRNANKYEVSGTLDAPGNLRVVAGVNIELSGFGAYDGKYAVETVTHTINGKGYHTMSISIRRGGNKAQKKKKGGKGKGGTLDWSTWDKWEDYKS